MKSKRLILDFEEEDSMDIGLMRFASNIPHTEIFFHLNRANQFNLRRLKDIVFHGQYNDYHFSSYIAYDSSNKNSWKIVSNKSFFTDLKRDQTLLFEDEGDVKYLLNDLHDVDYIVHSPDSFVDFSVILLPEMLFFPIQEFSLSSDTDLYQILQYYE